MQPVSLARLLEFKCKSVVLLLAWFFLVWWRWMCEAQEDNKSEYHFTGLCNYRHFTSANQAKWSFIYTINLKTCKCSCGFVCPLLSRKPKLKQMSSLSKSTVREAEYHMVQWSVITQPGSGPLSITCSEIKTELFRRKSRLHGSCCAFLDRIIDNLSVNIIQSSEELSLELKSKTPCRISWQQQIHWWQKWQNLHVWIKLRLLPDLKCSCLATTT